MKGILLAGGSGTRLFPLTRSVSKQLLPVYDKPAIYYPLSILMLAGIREILVISTPRDIPMIEGLLGDGKNLGIKLKYQIQNEPKGIAEAFVIGKEFINNEPVAMILGDNIFYGHKMGDILSASSNLKEGAHVFAYHVPDPENYGVVNFSADGKPESIEEKPKSPKSNWALTGLYFYDAKVSEYAAQLKPSARGEYEISDINQKYLSTGKLQIHKFGRGVAWLDMGTHESLAASTQFVQAIEKRQGLKIGCIEEVAFVKNYITREQLLALAESYPPSAYREYLQGLFKYGHI
jgi:glucose-1-phosphate thymidylyltransferase